MSAAVVDLLPPEIAARRRTRRVVVWTAVAVAAFVGVLGGVYAWQVSTVTDARRTRDAVALDVAAHQARVDGLAPYAEMAARLEARNTVLATAMAPEVSWARLLNDVSLALPEDAALQTLAATTGDAAADAATGGAGASGAADPDAVGRLDVTGYSTAEVSPGVRSVLDRLPEVEGLVDPYLSTAEESEVDGSEVTTFTLGAALDDGVRSHRYDDGLPAESTR